MFIIVTGQDLEARGMNRYLYGGQTVISAPKQAMFGEVAIVHSESRNLARDLADRLSSGLFGARVVETEQEALDYIAENH